MAPHLTRNCGSKAYKGWFGLPVRTPSLTTRAPIATPPHIPLILPDATMRPLPDLSSLYWVRDSAAALTTGLHCSPAH